MPFYDLKCKECGKEFNVMATMTEKEEKKIPCPDCGSRDLDRIYAKMNLSVGSASAKETSHTCPGCPHAQGCPHAKG